MHDKRWTSTAEIQAFCSTGGRCSSFYPLEAFSEKYQQIKQHTRTGRRNLDSALEYFCFSFGAKYYVQWQSNCGAVFKIKTLGQSLSNISREVLPLLAQLTASHQHVRGTSSVLHFAYLDLKCAESEYILYVHISVLSELAAVSLINCKLNYLGCIRKTKE